MSENESTLFRKSSLERVSSPDQLNQYVKVTNPSLIVMLVGIFTILIAGILWVFSGVIPKTASISGVVASDSYGEKYVYCFVPMSASKRISEGMEAQISPSYAERQEYGYISGTVESVGTTVVTNQYLTENFSQPELFTPLLSTVSSPENLVEVKLSMGKWSSSAGESLEVTDGSICSASVIIGGTKPYELIFNK